MGRHIILVDRGPGLCQPIVQEDDSGFIMEFDSESAAEDCASDQILCRSFEYHVIDLEDL